MKKAKLTQKEVGRLRRAVNQYNKLVSKQMDNIDNKVLPKLTTYKEVRNTIATQKDYEFTIRSLEKIKQKNAFYLRSSKENPNVQITNWEYQNLKRLSTRNKQRISKEQEKLARRLGWTKEDLKLYREGKHIGKFGNTRMSTLEEYRKEPLIELVENARDYSRQAELIDRLQRRGMDKFDIDLANKYKENYLEMLKQYKNLDGYEELVNAIDNTNSDTFYKALLRTDEAENYKDIQYMYDIKYQQAKFTEYKNELLKQLEKYNKEE